MPWELGLTLIYVLEMTSLRRHRVGRTEAPCQLAGRPRRLICRKTSGEESPGSIENGAG